MNMKVKIGIIKPPLLPYLHLGSTDFSNFFFILLLAISAIEGAQKYASMLCGYF